MRESVCGYERTAFEYKTAWEGMSAQTLDSAMLEAETDYQEYLDGKRDCALIEAEYFRSGDVQLIESIIARAAPKKPVQVNENFSGNFAFECPMCGHTLQDEYNDCFQFCPDCGQAINWEGVE